MSKREWVPLYAESINMIQGLDDGDLNQYSEENPKTIPLFEIDVVEIMTPCINTEELASNVQMDEKSLRELTLARGNGKRDASISMGEAFKTRRKLNLVENDIE